MRNRSIFLALLMLILACSITAIAAEDTTMGEYTYDIPDGYTINETSDEETILINDDGYVIVVIFSDEIENSEDAQKSLESQGYKFIGNDTYDSDDYQIVQQNFEKDNFKIFSYNFELDDGNYCVISFTIPSDDTAPEGEDNPVSEIIDSLEYLK